MSSFAVPGCWVCFGQGMLSGCRDVVDCRKFPREVRSSEGGSDNADMDSLALSAALGGSGGGPWRRGWVAGSGLSRQEGGD